MEFIYFEIPFTCIFVLFFIYAYSIYSLVNRRTYPFIVCPIFIHPPKLATNNKEVHTVTLQAFEESDKLWNKKYMKLNNKLNYGM